MRGTVASRCLHDDRLRRLGGLGEGGDLLDERAPCLHRGERRARDFLRHFVHRERRGERLGGFPKAGLLFDPALEDEGEPPLPMNQGSDREDSSECDEHQRGVDDETQALRRADPIPSDGRLAGEVRLQAGYRPERRVVVSLLRSHRGHDIRVRNASLRQRAIALPPFVCSAPDGSHATHRFLIQSPPQTVERRDPALVVHRRRSIPLQQRAVSGECVSP